MADDNQRTFDYGMLPDLIGYKIRLAQIATFRDFTITLRDHEMTPTLFGTLVLIEANPGLRQSELARAIQLDRSTVVTVIDTLSRRGLVDRRRAEDDRRSNALFLTDDGRTTLEELKRMVLEHEQRLVADLSEQEQQSLVSMLGRIFPDRR